MFAFQTDAVNKHMFTGTASLQTAPQLVLSHPLELHQKFTFVGGRRSQAFAPPELPGGSPAGLQSWLSTKPFQPQGGLRN